jgi:hypothetical protein
VSRRCIARGNPTRLGVLSVHRKPHGNLSLVAEFPDREPVVLFGISGDEPPKANRAKTRARFCAFFLAKLVASPDHRADALRQSRGEAATKAFRRCRSARPVIEVRKEEFPGGCGCRVGTCSGKSREPGLNQLRKPSATGITGSPRAAFSEAQVPNEDIMARRANQRQNLHGQMLRLRSRAWTGRNYWA